MKAQDRNYRLLEYLNVNTRTSYLARIRNPNPKMPDAQRIAVASLAHETKHHEAWRTRCTSRTIKRARNPEENTH